MTQGQGWARVCLMGFLGWIVLAPAWAQSTKTPEEEYKDLIRVDQDIQPLGEHPFGADIGLYNGSLSFHQTDVSLAGRGPLLSLSRSFEIGRTSSFERADRAFGDWDIALPRIETLTAQGYFQSHQVSGWVVNALDQNRRCASFAKPLALSTMVGGDMLPWEPATWWSGYHLVIPGHGSQDLLSNVGPDDATYPAVTKDHWRISCIQEQTTANGEPGDGFIAQSPDGTRYWFNELVYRWAPTLERPLGTDGVSGVQPPSHPGFMSLRGSDVLAKLLGALTGSAPAHAAPDEDFLQRHEAWMLVTKIEDRFGNTLIYNYDTDSQLTSICDSDNGTTCASGGRKLAIERVAGTHRIHKVMLQPSNALPREWMYTYDTQIPAQVSLAAVTLPDGRQWQFDLAEFANDASLSVNGTFHSCLSLGVPVDTVWTGSITHPSGLTGTFAVQGVEHGRSDVPRDCLDRVHGNDNDAGSYASIPKAWYSFTIIKKTFSGAGISATEPWIWQYGYPEPNAPSEPNDSWHDECDSGCVTTVSTKVLNPDGSSVKYTFSNQFGATETQLKKTVFYGPGGTLLREETNTYAAPDGGPWPLLVGGNPQERINWRQTDQRTPLKRRQIVQDGDTYTWLAEGFNTYAQVTKTKRFNDISGSIVASDPCPDGSTSCIEESTTYRNDTTLWVLGLPETTTNVATGEVVTQNVYDPSDDTLQSRYRFGQEVMDYSFNSAGQLESFTDGNGHATTLGDYWRGIPRTIVYPRTEVYPATTPQHTTQHLDVDDFGQITAITDQAGHTTQYTYDAAGRLTRITYPSGGVDWHPKIFTYSYIISAERGLAGGHWRRTVSQGNARRVTDFDALLRPVLSDTYIDGGTLHIAGRTDYNWKGLATFQGWPKAVTGTPDLADVNDGTSTIYDALGRVTAVSQPYELGTLTTTTTYLGGASRKVTDPEGNATTTRYQVFDQPSYGAVIQVVAASGKPEAITQTITRDVYGSPTSITQSGNGGSDSLTKYYFYDSYHRLCRSQEPETGSTLTGYDDANNPVWSVEGVTGLDIHSGCGSADVDARIVRTYDAMNRVLKVTYPSGTEYSEFAYDAMGQVAYAHSGLATWTYTRDAHGSLTGETLAIEGHLWSLGYAYDGYGNLDMLTYPDGKQVAYRPDALGRPTQAGLYATGVHYFADGAVSDFELGNHVLYVADENVRHLLHNFSYGTDSPIISKDRFYDKNANVTQIDDLLDDQRDKGFTYDALNRLTQATAPIWGGTTSYGYDARNNIRLVASGGSSLSYVYENANNHLVAILSGRTILHRFDYDTRGNTNRRDLETRVFDRANRLTQIGANTYAYDASGRRVKKTDAASQSIYYAYNSAGTLLYQWDATTGDNTDYIYLGKRLVAELHRSAGAPIMNPPTVSVDANPNNGDYTVSWSPIAGASSYDLKEQINGGAWNPVASHGDNSKTYSGRSGGSYRYSVRACNGDCSEWGYSTVVGVRPAVPTITAPGDIQSGSYTVSWTRPVSTTTFEVQEKVDAGSWQTIATTTDLSISRPGDTDGNYVYRVSASNDYGSRGWATSDAVTVLHAPAGKPSLSIAPSPKTPTGAYTVSWSSVAGATSYDLQQRKNNGSWSQVYSGSSRSKALSNTSNGATYDYQARACNGVDCGQWSDIGSVQIAIPPPEPTGVYANYLEFKSNNATLTVVWEAVSGAVDYNVRNLDSGSDVGQGITGTSYEVEEGDAPLSPDTYAVQSCNAYACSAWVTASRRTVFPEPNYAPVLTVPAGTNGSGSYTVSWGEVLHVASYRLEERVNGGSWHLASEGAGRSKAYSGKANGSYAYRVRASNLSGDGPWSDVATVTVLHPPARPATITVPATSDASLTVSWSSASTASTYTLRQSIDGAGYTTVDTGSAHSTNLTLSRSGSYRYAVKACNAGGCSSYRYSGYVQVTVPPTSAPSLNAPSVDRDGSYTVSWSSVPGATSYTLEERVGSGSWYSVDSSGRSKAYSNKAEGNYGYRVRGNNSGGHGPWSGIVTVQVVKVPGTPGGLSVWVTGPSYKPVVHVSWNAVSQATSYRLEETLPGQAPTTVNVGTATSTSALTFADGEVTYRVKACNAAGCSGWSGYRSVYLVSGSGGGGKGLGEEPTSPQEAPATDNADATPALTGAPPPTDATGDQP